MRSICGTKKMHPDMDSALQHIQHVMTINPNVTSMYVYECCFCKTLHVTNKKSYGKNPKYDRVEVRREFTVKGGDCKWWLRIVEKPNPDPRLRLRVRLRLWRKESLGDPRRTRSSSGDH